MRSEVVCEAAWAPAVKAAKAVGIANMRGVKTAAEDLISVAVSR